MSLTSKLKKARAIVAAEKLPEFVFRMDERPPTFVLAHGLQPKGDRTDAQYQAMNADPNVTVIEHVRKTYDAGGNMNMQDPFISFFAWKALQPINPSVMAFMQGYTQGYVYMVETKACMAGACNFYYANDEFDKAERTNPYPGQMEWSCKGTAPADSVKFVMRVPDLNAALNGFMAPDWNTLPWVGLAQA